MNPNNNTQPLNTTTNPPTNVSQAQNVQVPKIEVFCRLQFEGLHHWPDCDIEEVSYLADLHRHVFHIEARKAVSHDNRDTEFIVLKHKIEKYLNKKYPSTLKFGTKRVLGATSCEQLAKDLLNEFDLSVCIVSEDNENGAIVTK